MYDIIYGYAKIAQLSPVARQGTATRRYKLAGHDVIVGVIPSRTHPFCNECRRIRLTSEGRLLGCLFSGQGPSLRDYLREGGSDKALGELMRSVIIAKPPWAAGSELQMSKVGG